MGGVAAIITVDIGLNMGTVVELAVAATIAAAALIDATIIITPPNLIGSLSCFRLDGG